MEPGSEINRRMHEAQPENELGIESEQKLYDEFLSRLGEWSGILPPHLFPENADVEVKEKILQAKQLLDDAQKELEQKIKDGHLQGASSGLEFKTHLAELIAYVDGVIDQLFNIFLDASWSGDTLRRYGQYAESYEALIEDENSPYMFHSDQSPEFKSFLRSLHHIFRNRLIPYNASLIIGHGDEMKSTGDRPLPILNELNRSHEEAEKYFVELKGLATIENWGDSITYSFTQLQNMVGTIVKLYDHIQNIATRLDVFVQYQQPILEAMKTDNLEIKIGNEEAEKILGGEVKSTRFSNLLAN